MLTESLTAGLQEGPFSGSDDRRTIIGTMYCPKCAAENSDSGKFCRKCGTDISFVSRALSGDTQQQSVAPYGGDGPQRVVKRRKRKEQKPASLYNGVRSVFTALGFLLVAAAVYRFAPAGEIWWFWLLIPAFGSLGSGVAEMLRAKHEKHLVGESQMPPSRPPTQQIGELPPGLSHQEQPGSVTEGTTRILEAPSNREN
jgi:zinc-ribbon domain